MTITDRVRKLLWAEAAGRCSICRRRLVIEATDMDDAVVVGEEAHIVARNPGGARSGHLPGALIDDYENLILLCREHHKQVDGQRAHYTPKLLREIKAAHIRWAKALGEGALSDLADPRSWVLARDIDPSTLGVHRSAQVEGLPTLPPYVPRDQDATLQAVLEETAEAGGLVLVEGHSGAGKTRFAAQGMQLVVGERRVAAPDTPDGLQHVAHAMEAHPDVPCVLWLDDLHRFLGPDGLTPTLLSSLTSHGVVVLATLRTERALAYTSHNIQPTRGFGHQQTEPPAELAARALERATIVDLDRRWSENEIQQARLADDGRIDEAVEHADEFGIAEYLAAGPQVLADYRRAKAPGSFPRAAALIAAAVDLFHAGLLGALPEQLIVAVHEEYLELWGGARLRPEPLDEALAWATALRCGAVSPLLPGSDPATYEAFGYLVDAAAEADEPVPDAVWQAALAHTAEEPSRHHFVGVMAWNLGEVDIALQAWRPLTERGHGASAFRLGCFYQQADDADRAERCYRIAIDAGDMRGAVNLAGQFLRRGALDEAERWYRLAAEAGHVLAVANVAQLHHNRGDLHGAIRWYLRSYELGDTVDALHIVAGLYENLGQTERAAAWYDYAIEVGSFEAVSNAGHFHYRYDDFELAELAFHASCVHITDGGGLRMLGLVRMKRRDHAGAEEVLLQAYNAGDPFAAGALAELYHQQGRPQDADSWHARHANFLNELTSDEME